MLRGTARASFSIVAGAQAVMIDSTNPGEPPPNVRRCINLYQSNLLTRGPFGLVRHPTYSLSLLLMGCTMVVVANLPILLVGVVHIVSIAVKAVSEERHLLRLHGAPYEAYCRSTGRFLPGRSRRHSQSSRAA
jgi:protein-S-isoprenylcysteine O-methyltransferase Ste14